MKQVIESVGGGIKCDRSTCDYTDDSVTFDDYAEWLNRPCPKCGDNLLTEKDFIAVNQIHALMDLINQNPELVGVDHSNVCADESVSMRISFSGDGIPDIEIDGAKQ